ncbi:MAG: leucine-rich repeat protein [Butyribacter sp.]|nr:leucine-rich repeat protein [Butyribacter sp.]
MRKEYKKLLATSLAAVVALSGITVVPANTASAADTYSIYFACQANGSYVFRNGCADGTYGLGSEAFEGGLYDTEDVKWAYDAETQTWKVLASNSKGAGKVPAIVTDVHGVELTDEEQTYTIKCDADPAIGYLDWGDTGETHSTAVTPNAFNVLGISTTIPVDAAIVTGCKLYFDGKLINVHNDKDMYFIKEDDKANLQIDILNSWIPDLEENEAYTDMPEKNVEIQLTLKKNPEYGKTPSTPSTPSGSEDKKDNVTNNTPAKETTSVVGLAKNKTFTSGSFKYKVTTASVKTGTKATAGKVSVIGLSSKGKKAKKLTVPATVKKSGATYKVTAIGSKACKNAKATSVTLGKYTKTIGKSAFTGCKKLSKLTVKTKLSTVSKGAFKGCKKTIKVSGTSKAANVKKLKKSGYKKFK